jgi:malate/lactate dehydrogenase
VKIAIIGAAGTLGSCAAFILVNNKLADEILMIDLFESALTGHWMDLDIVGALQGVKVKKGTYSDMVGTDMVVMTAGAPSGAIKSRSELLPGSLPIIKNAADNINKYAPNAIVIMETNPVDPLNYGMYLMSSNQDRRRFIGYSINDTLRLRVWSARASGVDASRVSGIVIGEHGGSQVMLFSSLKFDDKPIRFDENTKTTIRQQPGIFLSTSENLVPRRTAGWTSAYGTAIVVEAVKNDSKAIIPCNAVLQGEYGLHNLSMTVPAVLGKRGIEDIKILQLNSEEKERLKHSANTIYPFMRVVEEFVGVKTVV